MNKTLHVPNLTRVAVGNGKLLKVKALPPASVLLTASKVGQTMVRVWSGKGREEEYRVNIVSTQVDEASETVDRSGVVKVALEFLELDMGLSKSSGVHWPEQIQFSAMSTLQGDSNTSGLNYSVSFASAKGWVSHLIREGWARMVASPDLYVRLGEEATFHSGGEFPVATSSENYGHYSKRVEWKPWGLTARVRPTSGDKLHYSSDISLEISELNHAQAVDGIPGLTKRKILTKMNSIDGETVILSGLFKQTDTFEKNGLPILGDIPVLGTLLFGSKSKGGEETELLMSVTFSMTTKSKEKNASDRFRKRMKALEE